MSDLREKLVASEMFTSVQKKSADGGQYTCLETDGIEFMCTHPYDSISTEATIAEADIIDGIPVMSLRMLILLKKQM